MPRSLPLLLVAAGLSACAYGEDVYAEDYAEASCEFTVQCYPDLHASVEACLETVTIGEGTDACTYDAGAARDCVDGVREMACPEEGAFPEFPAACANVYVDCTDLEA